MKDLNKIFIKLIIFIPIVACTSLQESLSPQKKSGSDEFLIEKKSPLVMPPSYGELPLPDKSKKVVQNKANIQEILTGSKTKKNTDKKPKEKSSLENLILKNIKKN